MFLCNFVRLCTSLYMLCVDTTCVVHKVVVTPASITTTTRRDVDKHVYSRKWCVVKENAIRPIPKLYLTRREVGPILTNRSPSVIIGCKLIRNLLQCFWGCASRVLRKRCLCSIVIVQGPIGMM